MLKKHYWKEMAKTRDKKHCLGVDALVQLAEGLDYKVILVPKNCLEPEGAVVLSDDESNQTE
jgi:hypothetical protein